MAQDTQHTPGPWHIGDPAQFWHEADGVKVTLDDSRSIAIDAHGWAQLAAVVVKFAGDEQESPAGQANARLIAASPLLYEALDALIAPDNGGVYATVNLIDAARAALKAARGE